MSLPRYTLGTGKAKKKKKKSGSVRERVSQLLGRGSSNGNGKEADGLPAPKLLFRPPRRLSTTPSPGPVGPKISPRYLELAAKDRELIEKLVALLERSFWGDPEAVEPEETISDPEEVEVQDVAFVGASIGVAESVEKPEEEDAPVLRIDPVETDPST